MNASDKLKQTAWNVKFLQNIPEYWGSMKPQNNVDDVTEDAWKKKIAFLDEVSLQNNVVIFLWNTYTNRFLYMSDRLRVLSGIDPALFTAEDGVAYSMSLVHPDHLEAAMQLQQKSMAYFTESNMQGNKNPLVCLNYLYKNGKDQYVQVLQRGMVLEADNKGAPTLALSIIHYVGHIKKADSAGCVLCMPDKTILLNYNFSKKHLEEPVTISDQEKKVIALLANGVDTKGIAKELHISPHTVATHRRNLIKKTNCIDSTGVVAYAKLINLI